MEPGICRLGRLDRDLLYEDVTYGYNDETFDLEGLRANAKALLEEKDIRRVKVYNILTSVDWDGNLKVDKCWIKENS